MSGLGLSPGVYGFPAAQRALADQHRKRLAAVIAAQLLWPIAFQHCPVVAFHRVAMRTYDLQVTINKHSRQTSMGAESLRRMVGTAAATTLLHLADGRRYTRRYGRCPSHADTSRKQVCGLTQRKRRAKRSSCVAHGCVKRRRTAFAPAIQVGSTPTDLAAGEANRLRELMRGHQAIDRRSAQARARNH